VLFEKADVNGAKARPVFQWLQTELTGTLGNGLKWNFTKFLVDPNGKPYKRFAPTTSPHSIEKDIVELLKQVAPEEKQAEPAKVESQDSANEPAKAVNVQKEQGVAVEDSSKNQSNSAVAKGEGQAKF